VKSSKPTKRILEIAKALGPEYCVREIDGENVVYRAINGYEFEVSGLDHNRERINAKLHIWDRVIGICRIETVEPITSLGMLSSTLKVKAREYATREHNPLDALPHQG